MKYKVKVKHVMMCSVIVEAESKDDAEAMALAEYDPGNPDWEEVEYIEAIPLPEPKP